MNVFWKDLVAKKEEKYSPVYSDDDLVEAAFDHFVKEFPYRKMPRHVCMQLINDLATMPTKKLILTIVANTVADVYHPHRFHSPANGMKSPYESWEDPERLKIALRKHLNFFGRIPSGVFSTLLLVNGTQACANFRPGFALYMYRKHCPVGGTVLDTSTGYGGRLVGFLASHCGHYIGVDPSTKTHKGNLRMAKELGGGDRVTLINLPAEDVPHEMVEGKCDFAFTSPPYFCKELYSDEDTQSWIRYKTGREWREGFLRKMLELQYAALKPGCKTVINIADVTINNRVYPLEKWTVRLAKQIGFRHIGTDRIQLSPNRWGKHKKLTTKEIREEVRRRGAGEEEDNAAREPVFTFLKPE